MVTCKLLYLRAKQLRIAAKDEIKLLFLDEFFGEIMEGFRKNTERPFKKFEKTMCVFSIVKLIQLLVTKVP